MKYAAEIIAQTGWTTQNLLSGMANVNPQLTLPYDLVTLLIGVNNQYQGLDTAQ
jgi:acyl-CoA thioesterase I